LFKLASIIKFALVVELKICYCYIIYFVVEYI
jgi:hypothetical protein